MSRIKVYLDVLSQPSRAVLIFLKKNNIPHEVVRLSVLKGEHKSVDYMENIHPFGKVPAIEDEDGWTLIESIGILRYLARKYNVPDHWYPTDLKKQGKVDEFLEWHHIALRSPLSMFFLTKLVRPLVTGEPAKQKFINLWTIKMGEALDQVENIWLKDKMFLTGNMISIADLIGLCEIEQPRLGGYEPTVGRPKLAQWMHRVKSVVQPHYDEVNTEMYETTEMIKSKL